MFSRGRGVARLLAHSALYKRHSTTAAGRAASPRVSPSSHLFRYKRAHFKYLKALSLSALSWITLVVSWTLKEVADDEQPRQRRNSAAASRPSITSWRASGWQQLDPVIHLYLPLPLPCKAWPVQAEAGSSPSSLGGKGGEDMARYSRAAPFRAALTAQKACLRALPRNSILAKKKKREACRAKELHGVMVSTISRLCGNRSSRLLTRWLRRCYRTAGKRI